MKKYFDTHCHLNGSFYKDDVDKDIQNAIKKGVEKIVLPGTNKKDSLKAIALAKKYPHNLFASIGIHPCDAFKNVDFFLDKINENDIVAIGETGIDLYHNKTNPSLEEQINLFEKHINLALKWNKPLIIHARGAEEEVFNVLTKYSNLNFIMHCYTGTWTWAEKFIALGGYISISGAITYNKTENISEVALKTPLDKLIIETDAPFLTPIPYRGKTNKPEYVLEVAKYIVSIREEKETHIIETLYKNALKIFKLNN